ncbi:hypothetical protein J7J95_00885 [bacterium]|nr:hypothetical protein [bacterium]
MKSILLAQLKKERCFILVVLLLLPSVLALFKGGFFSIYDDMQVIRLHQMDKCFVDRQIPCRWVPDLGYGYGYPLFQYYAPLPYYFMEIFHRLGFSLIASVKIGFGSSLLFSGIFFFLFLRLFFSCFPSLLGAILYVYAPARAADLYVRGAMGELWGMSALPLFFYSFERFIRRSDLKNYILFSFATFLLLVSHNLTVLMALPLLAFWISFRLWQVKRLKLVKATFFSLLGGLGLAAFFVVPLLLELDLVHHQTLVQGYFNYLSHFLNLYQIFFSLKWGYGPSIAGTDDKVFLGVGPVHSLLAFGGFLAAVFIFWKARNKSLSVSKKIRNILQLIFISFVLFLLYCFLAHQRSVFIWKTLAPLSYLQFPWRFIYISIFLSSFLGAFLLEVLEKRKAFIGVVLLCLVVLLYGRFFTPKDWIRISDKEKLSGENWQRQVTASIYDFLPKSAKRAPKHSAPNEVIGKDVETVLAEKGSNWQRYEFVAKSKQEVSLPIYYFSGWQVFLDGKRVETYPRGELGLISFWTEGGRHVVSAKFTRSLARKIGDLISLLTLLIYLALIGRIIKKRFKGQLKK